RWRRGAPRVCALARPPPCAPRAERPPSLLLLPGHAAVDADGFDEARELRLRFAGDEAAEVGADLEAVGGRAGDGGGHLRADGREASDFEDGFLVGEAGAEGGPLAGDVFGAFDVGRGVFADDGEDGLAGDEGEAVAE